eukprot:CAMPEP_0176016062 /NCGR_PEP_ID=MMETSP0120_2-20121206/7656_1 /TAXON_ID=160619 /ORGANISM="Kryptoperidinium foliaceum, Strain CCMP 1326" /LENGTH=169 /DNA_ID=CAMNT_0017349045 /DNA_START=51 /DNA_END=560 /DNA_ORIENTATION=+
MVNSSDEAVSAWMQPPFAGLDLRAVDLMSDNQMMPYKVPLFQNVLPQLMKAVRNPFDAPAVDYSDNPEQLEVIKHHYLSEFSEGKVRKVQEDYNKDSVIFEVLDEVPKTYHGKRGVRHVAINRNHAQVVWKAETAGHETIVGTDSFTFDDKNHIASQSIVALTHHEDEK